jgi:large subunit ribosomal protein L6
MSRIGRLPVVVPANVKVALQDATINVEGPKGKLSYTHNPGVSVQYDESARQVKVQRSAEDGKTRALHGLTRSLVANMVKGVVEGYTKKLEIQGVGYQAQLKGANTVALQVGYANQVIMKAPEGVNVTVTDPTHITVTGIDKQAVGQFAAEIRAVKPPEPYKGKGIRYEGEQVRRKAGKAFGAK